LDSDKPGRGVATGHPARWAIPVHYELQTILNATPGEHLTFLPRQRSSVPNGRSAFQPCTYRCDPYSLPQPKSGTPFTSELYEAEEVLGVAFQTDKDAALPLNPSKEALHEPASHIAA